MKNAKKTNKVKKAKKVKLDYLDYNPCVNVYNPKNKDNFDIDWDNNNQVEVWNSIIDELY